MSRVILQVASLGAVSTQLALMQTKAELAKKEGIERTSRA